MYWYASTKGKRVKRTVSLTTTIRLSQQIRRKIIIKIAASTESVFIEYDSHKIILNTILPWIYRDNHIVVGETVRFIRS
jgi:hypothetical protein